MYGVSAITWYFELGSKSFSSLAIGGIIPWYNNFKSHQRAFRLFMPLENTLHRHYNIQLINVNYLHLMFIILVGTLITIIRSD